MRQVQSRQSHCLLSHLFLIKAKQSLQSIIVNLAVIQVQNFHFLPLHQSEERDQVKYPVSVQLVVTHIKDPEFLNVIVGVAQVSLMQFSLVRNLSVLQLQIL